jgi:diguanylate cyclase (GGDEF)-like protein
MDFHLQKRLAACPSLPTAPAVALELLALCRQPTPDVAKIRDAAARDPVLAARVVGLAAAVTSSEDCAAPSLASAASALGPAALVAAALSFSLDRGPPGAGATGFDEDAWWRRAVAASAASGALAPALGADPATAALAGLLEDLGALALHEVLGREHAALLERAGGDHARLAQLERESFGVDHAAAGTLLARAWHVPAAVADAVARSHETPAMLLAAGARLAACAALGGLLQDEPIQAERAAAQAQIAPAAVERARAAAAAARAALPGRNELDGHARNDLVAQARETLVLLSFRAAQRPRGAADRVPGRTSGAASCAEGRRDPLTGLFERTAGELALAALFDEARGAGRPLSLALCHVEHLTVVNGGFGTATGEALLQAVAACLAQGLRDRDLAVRWGGGELLLALLGTDAAGAARVAARCRQSVAELVLRGPAGEPLRASLSTGLATLDARSPWSTVAGLLQAASDALDHARRVGHRPASSSKPVTLQEAKP